MFNLKTRKQFYSLLVQQTQQCNWDAIKYYLTHYSIIWLTNNNNKLIILLIFFFFHYRCFSFIKVHKIDINYLLGYNNIILFINNT
jgi:hypothetical protein